MGNCIRGLCFDFRYFYLLFTGLQLRKQRRIRVLFFALFDCFDLGGFVYAIASAACEFLYRKNNEYYDIKKKKKKKEKKKTA